MTKSSTGLILLVYLPKALESRIRQAARPGDVVVTAQNWADVTSRLREGPVDVLFVDPETSPIPVTPIVSQILGTFPSVVVTVYSQLTPSTVVVVHELSKVGLHHVVLRQYDDEPSRVRLFLATVPNRQLIPLVFRTLDAELSRLPTIAVQRVRDVFESPGTIRSVDEFASYMALSRTRLYELFTEVGLGSPKRLLIAARLLRAYIYLRDPGNAFSQVAAKAGFVDERVLRRYLAVFDMSVAQLRQCSKGDFIVSKLTDWIRNRSKQMTPTIVHASLDSSI